jgi:hypothetical protein
MKPMRVVAIGEDGAVKVRPLTWSERLAYGFGHAVGWLAAVLGFKRG